MTVGSEKKFIHLVCTESVANINLTLCGAVLLINKEIRIVIYGKRKTNSKVDCRR